MITVHDVYDRLPNTEKAVVILSGGMDSTIAMRLAVEKYRAENVYALSFDYGQIQKAELNCAMHSTKKLGVKHQIFKLDFLEELGKGFSANLDTSINMPTIKEVLGDPRPKTYVPNRNMILMSIVAAYAEVNNIETVIVGLQVHDQYGYHDTSPKFVQKLNDILSENRIIKIRIVAPFNDLSKTQELEFLRLLDGHVNLMKYTMTCYNPKQSVDSNTFQYINNVPCRVCPSCAERRKAFINLGIEDPAEIMVY